MTPETNADWLNFLTNIAPKSSFTSTTIKTTIKQDKPVISIPVDKLFELYGNLVLAGFTEDEALIIVTGIATHARGD